MLKFAYSPFILKFKEPAGTSRGVLKVKKTYFLRIADTRNPGKYGYGEVPFFEGLSEESESSLVDSLDSLVKSGGEENFHKAEGISSLVFGLEQAKNNLGNDDGLIFPSSFTSGDSCIVINGLIWMGQPDIMKKRIEEKLANGFVCIKLKIGAVNWEDEISLIKYLRDVGGENITIRVDANGAFTPENCMRKLEQLAELNVHSIEQPIKAGQLNEMKKICEQSPVPVALDEELIGWNKGVSRSELLDYINPRYIILKPALCFGFSGAEDWISRAKERGIGYWITSALESSVGLDAIAQFTGSLHPSLPQGLGTGALYVNNFASPLLLKGDSLSYNFSSRACYTTELEQLEWIA